MSFSYIFFYKSKKLAQFLNVIIREAYQQLQMIRKTMKKQIVLLFFISVFPFFLRAQGRLGLKFSTYFPSYRVSSFEVNGVEISGTGIRPAVALAVDIPLGQSYYIATGAGYTGGPLQITYLSDDGFETSVRYNLQYVQIPLTLRMLTNEIAIDKRIYTQIGSLMEVLVYNEGGDFNFSPVSRFNPVTFTFYFGAGLEVHLGTSTTLTIGLSYNRGISNLISEDNLNLASVIDLKKDLFGLDFEIRF